MFRKILLSVLLVCAFIIVTFFLLIKVIDFNEYKPRIHKALKESTGYEIIIRGDITLSLSPVGVSISDIEITNPSYRSETPFAKLGSFDVALNVASLLKKEIKVRDVSVDNLTLMVEKSKEGKFNYELAPLKQKIADKKSKESNATVEKRDCNVTWFEDVKKIKFSNANVTYNETNSTTNKLTFEKINLDTYNIGRDLSKQKFQGFAFSADAHIDKISYGEYALRDISMPFEMKDGIAISENLQYTLFDTPVLGSSKFDLSGKQPKISLKSKIVGLKLASLSKELWNKDLLEGNANGEFKLSFFAGDKSTLHGFVQLFGEEIVLKGYDLDKIASLLDPAQQNAHAFNFGSLISGINAFKGGTTLIKEANTKLDMGYSEIHFTDVALSTAQNRIAMKGIVNIVDEKLVNVKTALLNPKGCATLEQKFSGTFLNPSLKVDDSTITTLSNVVLSFSTKSKAIVPNTPKQNDENCTVFYEGVIKHPQPEPISAIPSGE
ncbi:AsmA family protein [Sulfurospirillum arsenophilum]|uniref:AsmA family protein n=1 Tax=Sulfurospirillum arsenophilum TaxID=56698 RepID=UPI0005AA553D|nr:AsmA family protein [Sulfurospirillum arsenophilum]